jgi:hypothetical protein
MAHRQQHIVRVPITSGLVALIQGYLDAEYYIVEIVNLAPVANDVLIVYYDLSAE